VGLKIIVGKMMDSGFIMLRVNIWLIILK